jgi:hypothetical protein
MAIAKATLSALVRRIETAHEENPLEPVRPPLRPGRDSALPLASIPRPADGHAESVESTATLSAPNGRDTVRGAALRGTAGG